MNNIAVNVINQELQFSRKYRCFKNVNYNSPPGYVILLNTFDYARWYFHFPILQLNGTGRSHSTRYPSADKTVDDEASLNNA